LSVRFSIGARLLLLALTAGGAAACGSILGIGDPTLVGTEGGRPDGSPESASGSGDATVEGSSSDAMTEASGDSTEQDAAGDDATGSDASLDADAAEAEACPAGQIVCSSGCVDPMTDNNNCMTCGTTCVRGQSCVSGVCQCPSGQTVCPGSDGGIVGDAATIAIAPYCADLNNDPSNCNTCGTSCEAKHDTPGCANGACTVGTCENGFADCNHDPSDGCEVYTQTDISHCGACNTPCTGGELCSNGNCVFTCPSGQTVCHTSSGIADAGADAHADAGSASTAYCATLPSDPQNCGACNNSCATHCVGNVASFSCTSNTCSVGSCAAGYFDVDGLCANGCECQAAPVGTCAVPLALGTLMVGGQAIVNGNLVPAGTDTYYQVTFSGNTASAYHPHVSLAGNPNGEFAFDILNDCSGNSPTCVDVDGGQPLGLTEWETQYQSGVLFSAPSFAAIPSVGTVLIHVYRVAGIPADCNTYTVVINN
jgi:hypothetical protein